MAAFLSAIRITSVELQPTANSQEEQQQEMKSKEHLVLVSTIATDI
jgi:hypothetical protein